MYLSCFHRLPVWFGFLNNLINIMYMNVKYSYLYLPEKLGVAVSERMSVFKAWIPLK
jgi:hypothetical protein